MSRCNARVWNQFDHYQCSVKNAKYTHNGKPYCGKHYPPNVEAKKKLREIAYNKKWEAQDSQTLKSAYTLVAKDLGIPIERLKELK